MRRFAVAALLAASVVACSSAAPPSVTQPAAAPVDAHAILKQAAARYLRVAQQRDPYAGHPRFTDANGNWKGWAAKGETTLIPCNGTVAEVAFKP